MILNYIKFEDELTTRKKKKYLTYFNTGMNPRKICSLNIFFLDFLCWYFVPLACETYKYLLPRYGAAGRYYAILFIHTKTSYQ